MFSTDQHPPPRREMPYFLIRIQFSQLLCLQKKTVSMRLAALADNASQYPFVRPRKASSERNAAGAIATQTPPRSVTRYHHQPFRRRGTTATKRYHSIRNLLWPYLRFRCGAPMHAWFRFYSIILVCDAKHSSFRATRTHARVHASRKVDRGRNK